MRTRILFPALFAALILGGCGASRLPAPPPPVLPLAVCPPPVCPVPACPFVACALTRVGTAVPAADVLPVTAPNLAVAETERALDLDHIDSLLTQIEGRLDTVLQLAAQRHIKRITYPPQCAPPALSDVVVAVWKRDTGGAPLAVATVAHSEVAAPATNAPPAPLVALKPCFYDPRGWALWLLLAMVAAGSAGLTLAIKRA